MAELLASLLHAFAEFGHFTAGNLGLPGGGGAVFYKEFFPAEERSVHASAGVFNHCMDGIRDRSGLGEQFRLEHAIVLGDLRLEDFFLRHGAKIADQADFVESPDRPLGGIVLPRFHAVPVVVLELVVEVVVALAKCENGHQEAVASRAMAGIGAVADPVAERVDAECGVMHEHDTGESRKQKRAECGVHAAVEITENGRKPEAHENGDGHIVVVLEPGETVFLQVPHPGKRCFRSPAKEEPPDVGMKKTPGNIVGIVIVIHEFVVTPMVGRPS